MHSLNNDYTNYYITIPAPNIETALWLESDRDAGTLISPKKSLDVQRNVVIEEFKQRYFNNPYGDIWLKLRPLAYKVHPYQWPTIGKNIDHIAGASLEEVEDFFHRFYAPDNAILSISGNITDEKALELVKKWFGDIPPARYKRKALPMEPQQTEERRLVCEHNKVPADAIYKVYHMGDRRSVISTRATRSQTYYPTVNPPACTSTSLKTGNYSRKLTLISPETWIRDYSFSPGNSRKE